VAVPGVAGIHQVGIRPVTSSSSCWPEADLRFRSNSEVGHGEGGIVQHEGPPMPKIIMGNWGAVAQSTFVGVGLPGPSSCHGRRGPGSVCLMSASSVVEQHIAAFNARRESDEPWSEDAEFVAPGTSAKGRDGVLAFLRIFYTAFPDGRLSVMTLIEDGFRAAVVGVFAATHDGPLASPVGDVLPTGRAVRFRWAALYQVDGSSLRSEYLFYDQADFLAQLGLQ
jgi:predicted ester cyclase